ncbi:aprataxin-like protein isoform X1 [Drosophila willistoni]|uniref:aprataxin-like protein isoform X1 n=1 Tax=Drosophila willistoni TaxID=7260 RepID=UPI000C26DA40|nr:aprataxin-like protein isoform X1 [Drosophila willistoni]
MQKPKDLNYFRGNLLRQVHEEKNILIKNDHAWVVNDAYPKAQYHFLVVSKEDIENVTKLTEDHLPLLDQMLDLAHKIIEEKAKDLSSNFLIGFKTHAFMNRLNLHVVSDDFHAFSMRRINHWNSFHTELFLPFQTAYMMLQMQGSIDIMSQEEAEKLKHKIPLTCIHCDFSTDSVVELKGHLFTHWKKREARREHKQRMETLTHVLEAIKLEEIKFEAEQELENNETEAAAKKTQEQEEIFKAQQYHRPGKYYPNYPQQNQAHEGFVPNRMNHPQQQHPKNQFPHKKYVNYETQTLPQQYFVPCNPNLMINPNMIMPPPNGINPNNPFRQQPAQCLQPRPNVGPWQNLNGGNPQMHYPRGPPRQPHPNYPNQNHHQGPRYPNNRKTQPQNGQQTVNQPKSYEVKSNPSVGKPSTVPNQKNQPPKWQQKKPPQEQQQQQSEQSKINAKKEDEASPGESKATAEAASSTASGKQYVKKKWPKKKKPNKAGNARGAAAPDPADKTQSAGPQAKPADT